MEPRSLKFIAQASAGNLRKGSAAKNGGAPKVQRVCTDSRSVQAGDLFIALAGERFDGHNFLAQATKQGAVAVLMERNKMPADFAGCEAITVEDTHQALGRLGAAYRKDFDLPIIAIGGSNGKTSTKELLASVLKQKLPILSSEASFNNDIGVPLTLLRLEKTHQAAVLEVGTNHPGELAPLVQMIAPKYGVITSIGREHLEFFGDVAAVAQEEGWLAELLPADGTLFVNGDSEWTGPIAQRARAAVVRVGFSADNEWRVHSLRT